MLSTLLTALLLALLCTTAGRAEQRMTPQRMTRAPHTTTDLLTFIRMLEAPRGYDDYERRIPIPPPENLTAMTVGAVLKWQTRVRASGAPSTAAGGYQIIRKTLQGLVNAGAAAREDIFDAATQDRLARALIADCGTKGPVARHPRYGNCLAGIWAALPLTAGPNMGQSAHHGVAGNRALTKPAIVLALLAGKPVPLKRTPASTKPRSIQIKGGLAFDVISTAASRRDIARAMRGAAHAGSLTPSIRTWKRDPYALE